MRIPLLSRSGFRDRRGWLPSRVFPTDDDHAMVRQLALGEFTGDTASPAGELLNRCCLTVPGT